MAISRWLPLTTTAFERLVRGRTRTPDWLPREPQGPLLAPPVDAGTVDGVRPPQPPPLRSARRLVLDRLAQEVPRPSLAEACVSGMTSTVRSMDRHV